MRARDYQRSKVYAWESGIFSAGEPKPTLTLPRITHLINRVCSYYKINQPIVKDGRGSYRAGARLHHEVKFPRHTRKRWIVYHEMAHIIHHRFCAGFHSKNHSDHGPFFVVIYMHLLNKFLKVDLDTLKHSAVDAGVDYGNIDQVDSSSIREYAKRKRRL